MRNHYDYKGIGSDCDTHVGLSGETVRPEKVVCVTGYGDKHGNTAYGSFTCVCNRVFTDDNRKFSHYAILFPLTIRNNWSTILHLHCVPQYRAEQLTHIGHMSKGEHYTLLKEMMKTYLLDDQSRAYLESCVQVEDGEHVSCDD